MNDRRIPHAIVDVVILDCLDCDASGVMPLYRDLIARSGCAPAVDLLLNMLFAMTDDGMLKEFLPKGMSRADALHAYIECLPKTSLGALSADGIGVVYELTDRGRDELATWRKSFQR
jgi:hypothetical protein